MTIIKTIDEDNMRRILWAWKPDMDIMCDNDDISFHGAMNK